MSERVVTYDELKLRISRGAHGRFQSVAFAADGATASGTFTLPFSEMELDNLVLRVGRPRRGARAHTSSHVEEAKRFGSRLFDAVVNGGVRDVYMSARRSAELGERGLRFTIYLTEVPELMNIPWEFLYERPSFLAQSIYTPVVRSLDLKSVRVPRRLIPPLRILGIISRPSGFDNLDAAAEQRKLADALGPLEHNGAVELHWLENATLSALDEALSTEDDVHVLHYIGHGAYDQRHNGGVVVLEDEHGRPQEVSGDDLGSLLQDEHGLRLVILNSCEGARTSQIDPFSGIASSLVAYGIPAVIGMQFEITDRAAIAFAGRLYSALVRGLPIDAAMAQARRSIFAAGNDIEFGTPVLFLRSSDARLFDVDHEAHPTSAESMSSSQVLGAGDDEYTAPDLQRAAVVDWSSAREIVRVTHRKEVRAIAFSADGRYLATAGEDRSARVWELPSGRLVSNFTHPFTVAYGNGMYSVDFRADGRRLAAAGRNLATVWDIESGDQVAQFKHSRLMEDVAFSPDGLRLASVCHENVVRIWDLGSGRQLARIEDDGVVHGVAFSPDGRCIATACGCANASIWPVDGGGRIMQVEHNDTVWSVAFSSDGGYLATGSFDHTARIWGVSDGNKLNELNHKSAVYDIAFSPDGTQLVTAGSDDTACIWDLASGIQVARLAHPDCVHAVAFSPDGRRLATACADSAGRVWEPAGPT